MFDDMYHNKTSVIMPVRFYHIDWLISSFCSLVKQYQHVCEIFVVSDSSDLKYVPILCAEFNLVRSGDHFVYVKYNEQEKAYQYIDIIFLHSDVHIGVPSACNMGLSESKGEFINFIGADDTHDDGFFLQSIDALNRFDEMVSCCSYRALDQVGKHAYNGPAPFINTQSKHPFVVSQEQFYQQQLREVKARGNTIAEGTLVIRASAFDYIGKYVRNLSGVPGYDREDVDLFARLSCCFNLVVNPNIMHTRREHVDQCAKTIDKNIRLQIRDLIYPQIYNDLQAKTFDSVSLRPYKGARDV